MGQFDDAMIGHILKRFNDLGNSKFQNLYLRGLIVPKKVNRVGPQGRGGKCLPDNPAHRRTTNFDYFVNDANSNRVAVCQKAFQSLHGITYRRVRTIRSQVSQISDVFQAVVWYQLQQNIEK